MAILKKKAATPKIDKETLTDADNPSLIKAGDEIRLRVFDDFFIEDSLPKWKTGNERLKALQDKLNDWVHYRRDSLKDEFNDDDIKRAISKLTDPDEQKKLDEEREKLRLMSKQIRDDRYAIKDKHEKSVKDSILKTAWVVLSHNDTWLDKLKKRFFPKKYAEQFVPVEIAFADLKSRIINTSTETLSEAYAKLIAMEKRMRDVGQIVKADRLKLYFDDLTAQTALVKAGFNTFINEEDLINFIRKSERGTRIDFLRYYEGNIPDEVLEKKKQADAAMVFDNYVVAFYDDSIKDAVAAAKTIRKAKKAKAKKEADREIDRRRDPILFGIVKGVRRLFYIADWVTPDDDLTMEVVEETLGIKRKELGDVLATGNGDMLSDNTNARDVVSNTVSGSSAPNTYYVRQVSNSDDWAYTYNDSTTTVSSVRIS